MFKKLISKLGLVTQSDAEQQARDFARNAISQLEMVRPGDELIHASRIFRKYGFRIVYAMSDDNTIESTRMLAEAISHPAWPVSQDKLLQLFLPNVKIVNDTDLLR